MRKFQRNYLATKRMDNKEKSLSILKRSLFCVLKAAIEEEEQNWSISQRTCVHAIIYHDKHHNILTFNTCYFIADYHDELLHRAIPL